MQKKVDTWFLWIVGALIIAGVFIFLSAAFGMLARKEAQFGAIVFNQGFSLLLGVAAAFAVSRIHYVFWKKISFYLFFISLCITALVFVPGVGLEHGGATRWLPVGPFSFQPSELLKISFVLYFSAWLSSVRTQVSSFVYALAPFCIMIGMIAVLMLSQPDTGTFLVIFTAGLALFLASGASWKHAGILMGILTAGLGTLVYMRPYLKERILTFLNPALDPQGAGYQIQQALIAVGSGEFFGRGFGQSVQKFGFLPEPVGDSVFAVYAEEFGFIGSVVLIALFVCFALRGLRIANHAPDRFSRLVVLGIVILITAQAFLNIGSIIGVFPLTGIPLPFVSHGGTALVFTLISVGILLNISRYSRL